MITKKIDFQGTSINVDKIAIECPYCHKIIIPETLEINKDSLDSYIFPHVEIICKCSNPDCCRFYLSYYTKEMRGAHPSIKNFIYIFRSTNIGNLKQVDFSSIINSFSPGFIEIYNQSNHAELFGLFQICGVGYRKALEFLIKDYLIKKYPEKENEIKGKFLSQCISDHIENANIKNVAKRAVWLGNDETHYIRKWEDKNIEDLKRLIDLTIRWIEMLELTEISLNEMPESG